MDIMNLFVYKEDKMFFNQIIDKFNLLFSSSKLPKSIQLEIEKYWMQEWEEINSIDAPMSGIGTMADFGRFQMGIAYYFSDKYPQYEDEMDKFIYELGERYLREKKI